MADVKIGRYKHYKNNYYQVVGFALDTETQNKVVLYHALYETPALTAEYGDKPIFSRPYDMFAGTVEVDGVEMPRFELVEAA